MLQAILVKKQILLQIIACLLFSPFLYSCSATSNMVVSSILSDGYTNLSQYQYAAIYSSRTVASADLKLEPLLEQNGLIVIGKKETKKYPDHSVLAVRYDDSALKKSTQNKYSSTLIIVIKDYTTDRTLLTINAQQNYANPDLTWQALEKDLKAAFHEF